MVVDADAPGRSRVIVGKGRHVHSTGTDIGRHPIVVHRALVLRYAQSAVELPGRGKLVGSVEIAGVGGPVLAIGLPIQPNHRSGRNRWSESEKIVGADVDLVVRVVEAEDEVE